MVTAEIQTPTAQEQKAALKALEPYQAISTPADAPAGSQLRTMADAAAAANAECADLEQRRTALQSRLADAQARRDAADATDDVAVLVAVRGEITLLVERLSEVETRLAPAAKAADEAQRDCDHAWRNVTNCRVLLEQQARTGLGGPETGGQSRHTACSQCLAALLSPGVPPMFRGWWSRSR